MVGSTLGAPDDAELRYVERDLTSFRSVLSELCGFDKNDIFTLYNTDSTRFIQTVEFLRGKISAQKENLFLFYYTGHANEKGIKFKNEIIPFNRLKELMASTGASIQIGIFDACQSGTMTTLKGGQLAAPFLFTTDTKIKGQVILSSSSPREYSLESDALQSSIFSFHLLNALRGSADITGDRKVSLSEAYQYAYNHTVSTTSRTPQGTQHPGYNFSIQGEGEIILADLSSRSSGLMLSKQLHGIITIFDEKNTLVADINKPANQPFLIALNKGRYVISCHSAGKMLSCIKSLEDKEMLEIVESDFNRINSDIVMRQKGEDESSLSRFDLSLEIHYLRPDYSNLKVQMENIFSQYNYFGITPSFPFTRSLPMVALSQEFLIKNFVFFSLSAGYTSMEQAYSFYGTRQNQFDQKTYGYNLRCNNNILFVPLSIKAGIRIRRGILKNLSLSAGITSYGIQQRITNTFTDSLYQYTSVNTIKKSSIHRFPSAKVRYQYFFNEHLATGISAEHTFHISDQANEKDETMSVFNPSEIDLSVQFTVSLFPRKER